MFLWPATSVVNAKTALLQSEAVCTVTFACPYWKARQTSVIISNRCMTHDTKDPWLTVQIVLHAALWQNA